MTNTFAIEPGQDDWSDGQSRARLVRRHNPNHASVWDLTDGEMLSLFHTLGDFLAGRRAVADAPKRPARVPADLVYQAPCPCECNSGRFCGGCGHAGCGRR